MPKIGDKVWVFDADHRVYNKDKKGYSIGSPIWREHWRENYIVGETRVSWLVGRKLDWPLNICKKFKKRVPGPGICFTEEALEDALYVREHAYTISRRVQYLTDAGILRQIADLVGYNPEKEST